MHLVVARTIDDVRGSLGHRGWCGVEHAATHKLSCLLIAPEHLAGHEGSNDARKLYRGISTIVVVVHGRAVAGSPLISTVYVDVYFLCAAEGVAACDTHLQLWTNTSNGASVDVRLNVEVPGLVEGAVQCQVQRVAGCRGVAGCELKLRHGEQSQGIDLAGGLQVIAIAVLLAGTQFHVG